MRRFIVLTACCLLLLFFNACEEGGGLTPGSGNAFESAGSSSMGIDDIVTDATYPVLASPVSSGSFIPFHLMIGATPEYYHGRYLYNNGGNIDAGRFSFKLVKNSNSTAYFAEWNIFNRIVISDPDTGTSDGTLIDLDVPSSHDSNENTFYITNEFKRYAKAKVNFGATTFSDITNAVFMFSEDFTTMVGGDSKLFFIATRGTSSPSSVDTSHIEGSWGSYQFGTNNGSSISIDGLKSDTYSATSLSAASISAVNGTNASFNGEAKLMSGDIGIFIYAEDALGINLSSIDGVFIVGPDMNYGMRFDLNTDQDIWAMDKF